MSLFADRLPKKHYFVIVFAVSCILLAGFTAALYRQSDVTRNHNEWVKHSYEVLQRARQVMTYALDLETGQRGYLLTNAKVYLEPYNASLRRLDLEVLALQSAVRADPVKSAHARAIGDEVTEFKKLLEQQIERFRRSGIQAVSRAEVTKSRESMDRLRNGIDRFIAQEMDVLEQRSLIARREQHNYFVTLFLGAALAVGGLVLANSIILGLMAKGRETEEQLRATEESYRMVLEGLDDGVYDYDPITRRLLFSSNYKRLLGYDPEELAPHVDTFNRLLHPDDYDAAWKNFELFSRREMPVYIGVFRLRHRNGSWRWILSRGIGQWDEYGELTRMIGTHTDITEQKEREEELKQLNADLASFAYIASHDLRAPLVNLKGFAGEVDYAVRQLAPYLDKARVTLPEKDASKMDSLIHQDIPESLGFIRSAVERMDMLTGAILDLSRIGMREYRLQEVDTGQLVKRCIDSLAYEIGRKQAEVICEELPPVTADVVALEQVFGNILDNAVKYLDSTRGGRIIIRARQIPRAVQFTIEDNGRGIAPHEQQKVFDIFRRAANSSDVRGAGMGMAYVKATVRKMGGKLWFDSKLGKGTAFHFTVPELEIQEKAA